MAAVLQARTFPKQRDLTSVEKTQTTLNTTEPSLFSINEAHVAASMIFVPRFLFLQILLLTYEKNDFMKFGEDLSKDILPAELTNNCRGVYAFLGGLE